MFAAKKGVVRNALKKIIEIKKKLQESNLESMGEDRHGNLFWYFGGIHLYKQVVKSDTWEVIARSKLEWRQVRDSYRSSSDKEEVWFRETIEQNFDPNLSDIEKETRTWAKKRKLIRIKKLEKKGKRKHKKIYRRNGDTIKSRTDHLEEEFDALAARLGIPKTSEISTPKPKSVGRPKKSEKPPPPSSSSSSDSSDDEEEKPPESPGSWEIVPGSSATRPQFIKIRPGETLESALEQRNGGATENPVKSKRRNSTTKQKRGRPARRPSTGDQPPKRAGRPPTTPKVASSKQDSDTDSSDSDIEAPPPISQRSKFAQIEKARNEKRPRSSSGSQSDSSTDSDRIG